MTRERAESPRCSRRALAVACALTPLAVAGCSDSAWAIRRDLAAFSLPQRVPLMVFKSSGVRQLDHGGYTDLVMSALEDELAKAGVRAETADFASGPRLPRIELAFRTIILAPEQNRMGPAQDADTFTSITVDCAFVSVRDEVAFVGRVVGQGKDGNLASGAEAAGRAIAKALLRG